MTFDLTVQGFDLTVVRSKVRSRGIYILPIVNMVNCLFKLRCEITPLTPKKSKVMNLLVVNRLK